MHLIYKFLFIYLCRDFGPRLFTAIAGWGLDVFTAHGFYTWIPLVAPLVGGLAAGVVSVIDR